LLTNEAYETINLLPFRLSLFLVLNILQGSVAMHIKSGGIFNNDFIANLLVNISLKVL